jgi:hypothetical protein
MHPRRTAIATLLTLALGIGGVACSKDQNASSKAFCRKLRQAPTLDSVVSGFADVDADELDKRLDAASTAFHDLNDSAPGAVRGDVKTMVELVDTVIASVKSHKDDPEAAAAELRTVVAKHKDAARASLNVARYAARECSLSLNPSEPTTTTRPGSTGSSTTGTGVGTTDLTTTTTIGG